MFSQLPEETKAAWRVGFSIVMRQYDWIWRVRVLEEAPENALKLPGFRKTIREMI